MSLPALLSGDTITVQRPTIGTDLSGGPTYEPWVAVYTDVDARVEDSSASQTLGYALLGMHVTHRVFTQQEGIKNGDRLITSGNLVLRVEGVQHRRAIGSMPDFFTVTCEEVRLGHTSEAVA